MIDAVEILPNIELEEPGVSPRERRFARSTAASRPLPRRHANVSAIMSRSKTGSQTRAKAWCSTRSRKHGAVISRSFGSKIVMGILWLAYCREHAGGRRLFEGLKVVVPQGTSEVTRARMAWMNPALAKWNLYELDERTDELACLDLANEGNLDVRLVHAFNREAALERSRPSIDRVFELLPQRASGQVEVLARSAAEVAFLLHGLEFAGCATVWRRTLC